MFIPLKDLPASVQENWTYNPTKAKQLLSDAGYPNGFKLDVMLYPGYEQDVQLIADYWNQIGVTTNTISKEYATFASIVYAHQFTGMAFWYQNSGNPLAMANYLTGNQNNFSGISDAKTDQTFADIMANYSDFAKKAAIYKAWVPYALDQSWIIQGPNRVYYYLWQPWLKGYYGTSIICDSYYENIKFSWIDQDLKQQIAGTRN